MQEIGKTIALQRRAHGWTQEQFADMLEITPQAVSKWECGQSMPDIAMLPRIAGLFDMSIDSLLGNARSSGGRNIYADVYSREGYYWGLIPSDLCYEILRRKPPLSHLKVLDIGCGEGKDALFLARNGYDVQGFDLAVTGIEKALHLAQSHGFALKAQEGDINSWRANTEYDVFFSSGVFHYIEPSLRDEIMWNYMEHTAPGGLHAFNVFVDKPFIAPPPENEPVSHPWKTGELAAYYAGWIIHDMREVIFDCDSSGIPHRHAMNTLIAQKPLD